MSDYITTKELAALRGVTVQHLINQRSKDEGAPYYKIRDKVYYKRSEIEEIDTPVRYDPGA